MVAKLKSLWAPAGIEKRVGRIVQAQMKSTEKNVAKEGAECNVAKRQAAQEVELAKPNYLAHKLRGFESKLKHIALLHTQLRGTYAGPRIYTNTDVYHTLRASENATPLHKHTTPFHWTLLVLAMQVK